MGLSKKKKAFLSILLCIFEIHIKFGTFKKKKMTHLADVFPILRTPKNVVRYISEKSLFRRPFERQHGKPAQTLLESERQHRLHI